MKTIKVKIEVESEIPIEQVTDSNIEKYRNRLYGAIQNETDDNAKIDVTIELV